MIKLLLFSTCLLYVSQNVDAQTSGTLLALPEAELCINRPKEWKWSIKIRGKEAVEHNYFFSWNQEQNLKKVFNNGTAMKEKVNWLEARNECRKMCMDTIGIETLQESELVQGFFKNNPALQYIWTSGRLCDFKGCETRGDLHPTNVLGWFWSNTNTKMAPTNSTPPGWTHQPWSQNGHNKIPQPDNAEFGINQTPESCMGVLNNIYNDGLSWHDIACYHKKPYICEDSDVLLQFIAGKHPDLEDELIPNKDKKFNQNSRTN